MHTQYTHAWAGWWTRNWHKCPSRQVPSRSACDFYRLIMNHTLKIVLAKIYFERFLMSFYTQTMFPTIHPGFWISRLTYVLMVPFSFCLLRCLFRECWRVYNLISLHTYTHTHTCGGSRYVGTDAHADARETRGTSAREGDHRLPPTYRRNQKAPTTIHHPLLS